MYLTQQFIEQMMDVFMPVLKMCGLAMPLVSVRLGHLVKHCMHCDVRASVT